MKDGLDLASGYWDALAHCGLTEISDAGAQTIGVTMTKD